MAAGKQILPERLDRRRRYDFIAASRNHQNWLADAGGISGLSEQLHLPKRGICPGYSWRPEAERGLLLEHRGVTSVTDGI
jgi:hypothetical protein